MAAIGIFGGSFNPIHNGHLHLAESIKIAKALDEIWLIPAFISPFKQSEPPLDCFHRIKMCESALDGKNGYRVLDIECQKMSPSYTYDTLMDLKKSYPENRFYLILGHDSAAALPSWHKADELIQEVDLLIGARSHDVEWEALKKYPLFYEKIRQGWVPINPLEISSSEIRHFIKEKKSINLFVPEPVSAYIKKYQLYSDDLKSVS